MNIYAKYVYGYPFMGIIPQNMWICIQELTASRRRVFLGCMTVVVEELRMLGTQLLGDEDGVRWGRGIDVRMPPASRSRETAHSKVGGDDLVKIASAIACPMCIDVDRKMCYMMMSDELHWMS